MNSDTKRALAGFALVAALVAIFVFSLGLFRGSFTESVPVTVISQRAGLVMNPDAKVEIHGVQVGTVDRIDYRPNGTAALSLALEPQAAARIPSNVAVDITSSTVFGAKHVELRTPTAPSRQPLREGQVISADQVTVEINTIFQRLTTVLAAIKPDKLNESLTALATGLSGRGAGLGETIADLDVLLTRIGPSLPNLERDLELTPTVLNAYADAAPDLLTLTDNVSTLSRTVVERQDDLDTFLVSAAGLAGLADDVLSTNRENLSTVLQQSVSTTSLLNQYSRALTCSLTTVLGLAAQPPLKEPGAAVLTGFTLGAERYRYPGDLPKVAATGGPQCLSSDVIPPEARLPFVVADTGANPWQYGNEGILLNSDGLKQYLFGPLDGPPRNTAQIGQPG